MNVQRIFMISPGEFSCRLAGSWFHKTQNLDPKVPGFEERFSTALANDLPLWHGAQLAVDVTLVSPLGRTGQVRHASDANPGAAILAASQRKREHTYPEFSGSRRCHLIILGLEVGGRWGEEAADFLRALAHARARTAPALLRSAAVQAYVHRWAGLLSVAAQRALAETLLELPAAAAPGVDGEPPPFAATLADVRWHERPPDSRLPRWPVWLCIASPNGKVHWRVRRRVDHAAGKKINC